MAAQNFENGELFMADDPFCGEITMRGKASGRMAGWSGLAFPESANGAVALVLMYVNLRAVMGRPLELRMAPLLLAKP